MGFEEIKSLLTGIDDPAIKLEVLMDIGKTLPPIPAGETGIEIKGCASRVEIFRDKFGKFYGAADSALVRGIVAVLLSIAEERSDFSEFGKLNLNLGAARLTGTASMIEYLKTL
ncbi:MAG: SufE family protein [Rickettsiales bacterium]|jgi:sulfur transfer protein SufE|nr:SufE family protein [Rickettsiales bacterium]